MILVVVFIMLFTALGCGLDFVFRDLAIVDGHLTGFPLFTFSRSVFGSIQSMLSYLAARRWYWPRCTRARLHPIRPKHQMVLDVVREMALAARMPVPKAYIIDDPAPNAFATGRNPEHSVVCVTQGLIDKMDREEVQGVIGHEMAHVRDYDIRTMMMIAVLVGGIAMLADFVYRWMWYTGGVGGGGGRGSERRDDRNSGGNAGALIESWCSCLRCLRRFSRNCSRWRYRASANTWPTPLRSSSRAIRGRCCARSSASPRPNRRSRNASRGTAHCSSSIHCRALATTTRDFRQPVFDPSAASAAYRAAARDAGRDGRRSANRGAAAAPAPRG